MPPLLLALSSAVLLVVVHAPLTVFPAALVGVIPLLALARRTGLSRRQRYGAAYAGGVAFFLLGCHWLAHTAPINLVLMTLVEACAFPLVVFLLRCCDAVPRLPIAVATAVAWTAVEFVRSHVPFNGFPWLLLGYAADRPRELAQAADLVGVHGLSFVFAGCAGQLYAAWSAKDRRGIRIAPVMVVLALLYVYGASRIASIGARSTSGPTVALVQGNVAQELKQLQHPVELWTPYYQWTVEGVRSGEAIDLFVWPETMFATELLRFPASHDDPTSARYEEAERRFIGKLVDDALRRTGASLLVGVLAVNHEEGRRQRYNSAILYDPEGRRLDVYDKSIRVPGGEFIPFLAWLPSFVPRLVESIAGFLPGLTPGDGPRVLEAEGRDGPYRFAPTICYENTYPSYNRRAVALGADFILNLSNEGWFKDSAELDQMEVASRFRAIETRRSVVRATNTGISAIYDAVGRRTDVLLGPNGRDREVPGVLIARVPIYSLDAWYLRIGDSVAWIAVAAASVVALLRLRRRYPAQENA